MITATVKAFGEIAIKLGPFESRFPLNISLASWPLS